MPELPPSILNSQVSSKSLGRPSLQIRKVFFLIGLAALVRPVITPSSTDQRTSRPRQPLRSWPLNISITGDWSAGSSAETDGQATNRQGRQARARMRRMGVARERVRMAEGGNRGGFF